MHQCKLGGSDVSLEAVVYVGRYIRRYQCMLEGTNVSWEAQDLFIGTNVYWETLMQVKRCTVW